MGEMTAATPARQQYRRVSRALRDRCLAACGGGKVAEGEAALLARVARGWSEDVTAAVTKQDYEAALALLARLREREAASNA